MQQPSSTTDFRETLPEDALPLAQWLSDPKILQWFPMCDAREIEDAVRIWISYGKIGAGITALWNQEPCGMANLYIQPYKKQAHTCLFSIIVREEMRGRGIGKQLLEQLMKLAKEKFHIEILHLEVYEGNPARRLYERMGFKEFGCQTRFVKENGKYRAKFFLQRPL